MPQLYDDPFYNLLEHIRLYSQRTPQLLERMRDTCGQEAAYYAAFIFIVLQATTERPIYKPIAEYTPSDFHEFAFFEVEKDDPRALELFQEMLRAYQADRGNTSS